MKYYRKEMSLEEAFNEALARTKAFCRRQNTWFKKFEPAAWFDVMAYSPDQLIENVADTVLAHLNNLNEVMSNA